MDGGWRGGGEAGWRGGEVVDGGGLDGGVVDGGGEGEYLDVIPKWPEPQCSHTMHVPAAV